MFFNCTRVILFFLCMIVGNLSFAQYLNRGSINLEEYLVDEKKSDFEETFKTEDDLEDFKGLREYLRRKNDLKDGLNLKLKEYPDNTKYLEALRRKTDAMDKALATQGAEGNVVLTNDLVDDRLNPFLYRRLRYVKYFSRLSGFSAGDDDRVSLEDSVTEDGGYLYGLENAMSLHDRMTQRIEELTDSNETRLVLSSNLDNVQQDIYDCNQQIESALAPEYKQQKFRKEISLYFTILIGILLTIFFYIVFKKSGNDLSKDLLSGYGLQFVTLFVLIIAVILFGILGILQGSELAAILSGISGYILGKGVDKDKDKDPEPALQQ